MSSDARLDQQVHGALLEQVKLGAGSNFLVAAPDGNALIVLGALAGTTSGEFALRVVDLR